MRRTARTLLLALLVAAPAIVPAAQAAAVTADRRTVHVSTGDELARAIADARPGDTIRMADGTYRTEAFATVPGTASAPITLVGSRRAVVVNNWFEPTTPCPAGHTGYGVWLNGASYWHLKGFTVADSKKGIVVDRSQHVVISGVLVERIGEEGVHWRKSSSDGLIIGSTIRDTGRTSPGIGEGLYIGSAYGNWRCHGEDGGTGPGGKGPDRSDRVRAVGNRIGPGVTAEHIDIKEGTVDGQVIGNYFDGNGLTGEHFADSWIDAKGSNYLFLANLGIAGQTPGSALAHGYETHHQYNLGYGCGNVFRANASYLGGKGEYAFHITNQADCGDNPNVVYDSNLVWGATGGLANIPVTPER